MAMQLLNKRYHLVRRLGIGGMSVVYKAADTYLGNRFVAVKEMSQSGLSLQESTIVTQAFRREALLLASLSHQSLPRIYDHFTEGGNSYLVMDFIEGETLSDLLQQANGCGLLVEEVLYIGEQLCSVLDYLHTRQPPIIFRDLKPANIMITYNGNHLYLIDFGIARLFKIGQLRDTLAFGTPGYAAPEQYGAQTTEQSDIYSLGATLHQLLTNLDPSKSIAPFSFPSIRTRNVQTPPALEKLILQMVEIDPAKRPASMLVVKRELQRIARLHNTAMVQPVIITPTPAMPATSTTLGTTFYTYRDHSDSVAAVAWSPDGQHIASGGRDKKVQVWEAATGNKIYTYTNHTSYIYGVKWSPDGRRIASTSFGSINVWDFPTGDNLVTYRGHALWVYTLAWSHDGRCIISGGADGEVHLWIAATGNNVYKYQGYTRVVKSVAWSPGVDSTLIVSASEDSTLRSWDAIAGSNLIIYQGHTKEVSCVDWSRDGTKIVSGSRDKTVRIWDAHTANTLYTYHEHPKEVLAVAWSPDGRYIASAGEDKIVRIWEAATGKTIHTYRGHTREVYAIAWSPDSTRIASASDDKTVQVWQAS